MIASVFGDFSLEALTGTAPGACVLAGFNSISKISPELCLHYFTTNLIWTFQSDSTSLLSVLRRGAHTVFPFLTSCSPLLPGTSYPCRKPAHFHSQANLPSPPAPRLRDLLIHMWAHFLMFPLVLLIDAYCCQILLISALFPNLFIVQDRFKNSRVAHEPLDNLSESHPFFFY